MQLVRLNPQRLLFMDSVIQLTKNSVFAGPEKRGTYPRFWPKVRDALKKRGTSSATGVQNSGAIIQVYLYESRLFFIEPLRLHQRLSGMSSTLSPAERRSNFFMRYT
jgi:hypothetical protein